MEWNVELAAGVEPHEASRWLNARAQTGMVIFHLSEMGGAARCSFWAVEYCELSRAIYRR